MFARVSHHPPEIKFDVAWCSYKLANGEAYQQGHIVLVPGLFLADLVEPWLSLWV